MYNHFKTLGTTFSDTIDWYNIMFYDVANDKINNPDTSDGRKLAHFEIVYNNTEQYIDKDKIVMGFEPGH